MTTLLGLARQGSTTLGGLARSVETDPVVPERATSPHVPPARAISRVVRRASVYQGAAANRLLGDWIATLQPPDEEMRWSLERLRARCRELSRNNSYCVQYLGLLADNVVGPHGIKIQAQTRNADGELSDLINDKIEDAWDRWSESVTIDGRFSRLELEHQLIESVARDGEIFVREHVGFPNEFGYALEPIDADLLDVDYNIAAGTNRNEIRMGVEVDTNGRPLAYWFWDGPITGLGLETLRRRRRIPATEVIHLFHPKRVHQTRGLPWLTPAMLPLREVDSYQENAVIAARVGAAQMAFLTKRPEAEGEGVVADEDNLVEMNVEPGQIPVAPDGYDIASWNPNHPNTNHADFVKTELRRVATALGVSYNVLCNDLESVNFASYRAGLLPERDRWRKLQTWFISRWSKRIFRGFLSSALLTGALILDTRDFRRFLEVRYSPRGWPAVDPKDETEAAIAAIGAGLASRRGFLAEQGKDVEEIFEDIRDENELAADLGVTIEQKTPAPTTSKPKPPGDDEEAKAAKVTNRIRNHVRNGKG